jgi:1-deoxy-D-xylulose-5-phosphate reductoisomerase
VKMKNIAILGSTGSIGVQTLEVARANKDIRITALAANSNIQLMEEQMREFKPRLVAIHDEEKAKELRGRTKELSIPIVSGMNGLTEVAQIQDTSMLVTAIVGMIGTQPTIAAIESGKDIALANKETLVCAGHIIMPLAKAKKVKIIPVDSEHSAVFQSLQGNERSGLHKIILTASGGPFLGKSKKELEKVTLEEALKHPNWVMGHKITIDSSTMVNKGLEVIEAKWLFDLEVERIQVVIQPTSIIHSMVEYIDGGIIAQMGTPDMKLPIQYALYYPHRKFLAGERLDFEKISRISFQKPDCETFYGLKLAYEAGKRGGSLPTVYNAANEKAVALFIEGKINFLQIPEIIEKAMNTHKVRENPSIETILDTENETYAYIKSQYAG